eukprot:8263819-Ditylum_brightwellii.AAC.1
MEPEAAGSCLDTTIGAELTALKRTAEGFTTLQYYTRSMRIIASESAHTLWAYCHVRKRVKCRMDIMRKIGSRNNFTGPFKKALASPQLHGFMHE